MADISKILSHPDKEEIIGKLMTGIKPKDVADWLIMKYQGKDKAHLRIPITVLKDFVDQNGDMYTKMQQDVAKAKNGQLPPKALAKSLLNNKTYQERINELADHELDLKDKVKHIVLMIESRMEQFFDKLQENPENVKLDRTLIEWFKIMLDAVDRANKIINEAPDTIVQHNVSLQTINHNTIVFQDVIRETMAEVDPQMAFIFMEKLNDKLNLLEEPKPQVPMTLKEKDKEVMLLSARVDKKMGDQ